MYCILSRESYLIIHFVRVECEPRNSMNQITFFQEIFSSVWHPTRPHFNRQVFTLVPINIITFLLMRGSEVHYIYFECYLYLCLKA